MSTSECPWCGEPDPIYYPGEHGEPDIYDCPECGHEWEAGR